MPQKVVVFFVFVLFLLSCQKTHTASYPPFAFLTSAKFGKSYKKRKKRRRKKRRKGEHCDEDDDSYGYSNGGDTETDSDATSLATPTVTVVTTTGATTTVTIDATVTDSTGSVLSGATVNIFYTNASGEQVSLFVGSTDSAGNLTGSFVHNSLAEVSVTVAVAGTTSPSATVVLQTETTDCAVSTSTRSVAICPQTNYAQTISAIDL
ncbi:MAG: hypothetical protein AAF518_17045 [Spirochaetota bacterium]